MLFTAHSTGKTSAPQPVDATCPDGVERHKKGCSWIQGGQGRLGGWSLCGHICRLVLQCIWLSQVSPHGRAEHPSGDLRMTYLGEGLGGISRGKRLCILSDHLCFICSLRISAQAATCSGDACRAARCFTMLHRVVHHPVRLAPSSAAVDQGQGCSA